MRSGRRDGSLCLWLAAPIVFLSSLGSAISASGRFVTLIYARGAGATECPDEDAVRAGVAARLGYEPFDARAETRISATVMRTGRAMEAKIVVADAAGRVTAERRLSSRGNDCTELTSAMELAISIAIDPVGGVRPKPVEKALPPPPPAPPAPPPPPPTIVQHHWNPPVITRAPETHPPTSAPLVIQVSTAIVGSTGSAPARALGGIIEGSARRGAISLGLEGRADLPVVAPLRTGDVRTSLLTGSFVPCLHSWILAGCLVTTAGAMRASGHDLIDAQAVTVPYLAVGGRLALEVPVTSSFLIRLHGDVMAPVTETILQVSGGTVWSSPSVCAALGLGIGARFR